MKKLLVLGMVLISINVIAQDYESGVPYQMGQIYIQMSNRINDVPEDIQRLAVYKLNYNQMQFTAQEVDYIRHEIEAAFREYACLTVLSPPELEPTDKMKIIGNDSTLQILNVHGRSLANISSKLLTEVTTNYEVQGLLEVGIQKRTPDGLILSLSLINPRSMEIVWTKRFISNQLKIDKNTSTKVITFGVGYSQLKQIIEQQRDDFSSPISTSSTEPFMSYSTYFTYRQPVNLNNNTYLGFTSGIKILRSINDNSYDLTMFDIAVNYYQAILDKNKYINDYRWVFFINGKMSFPYFDNIDNIKSQVYSFTPGFIVNISTNLGLILYTDIIISDEILTLQNNDKFITTGVEYGLQAVFRF